MNNTGCDSTVRYHINHRDEITFVNEAWDRFAESNEGSEVVGSRVLGRVLWDFISDRVTRRLYKQIVARVRQGRQARFGLRCDGPSSKRHLEMTIRATGTDCVEFSTRNLGVEDRPPVALLAKAASRSTDLLRACSWCNRFNVQPDAWVEVEIAVERLKLFEAGPLPQLTHGMCDTCFANMSGTLDDMKTGA